MRSVRIRVRFPCAELFPVNWDLPGRDISERPFSLKSHLQDIGLPLRLNPKPGIGQLRGDDAAGMVFDLTVTLVNHRGRVPRFHSGQVLIVRFGEAVADE